jgi:hypothetical protein
MALLAFDGFDHYGTDADLLARTGMLQWVASNQPSGNSVLYAAGRSGTGKCGQFVAGEHGSWLTATINSDTDEAFYGIAVRVISDGVPYFDLQIWDDLANNAPFTFRFFTSSGAVIAYSGDPSTTHIYSYANGHIIDEGPGTFPIATSSSNVFNPFVWNFLEMHVTQDVQTSVAGSLTDHGTFELKVNGVNVLSGTGAATFYPTGDFSGAGNYVNTSKYSGWRIKCGEVEGEFPGMEFDDFYCLDNTTGSGANPLNTYLGDCAVNTTFPTANISVQWAALANQNWQEVATVPFAGDNAYNNTLHDGYTDKFTFGAVPADSSTVIGVQVTGAFRSLNVSGSQIDVTIQSGSSTSGEAFTVLGGTRSAYAYYPTLYVLDPNTGADWTISAVNALTASYTLAA